MDIGSVSLSMYHLMYLAVPIFASLLYVYRKQEKLYLLIPIGFMAVLIAFYHVKTGGIGLVLNLFLISGVVLTYAIAKGWYFAKKKMAIGILWAIVAGIPTFIFGMIPGIFAYLVSGIAISTSFRYNKVRKRQSPQSG